MGIMIGTFTVWGPLSSREDSPYAPTATCSRSLWRLNSLLREVWSGLRHGGRTTKVPSRRVFLPWTGGATRPKVNTARHEPVRSPGPSLKY
jgi:hypothetical protein